MGRLVVEDGRMGIDSSLGRFRFLKNGMECRNGVGWNSMESRFSLVI